jgi:hypothetical protein
MIETALADLGHGFGVALQLQKPFWWFFGVLIGNIVGVVPGTGVLAAISILLPLTDDMVPVAAAAESWSIAVGSIGVFLLAGTSGRSGCVGRCLPCGTGRRLVNRGAESRPTDPRHSFNPAGL